MTLLSRRQVPVDPVAHAEAEAARLRAEVEHAHSLAALALQTRAAEAEAARAERAAVEEEKRRAAAARRARWASRAAGLAALGRRARPVAPLVIVTGFAVYGQVAYGLAHYPPQGAPRAAAWAIALGAALAVESIALYVQWHAHDALLAKATATAARLRRASYAIALVVAGINYAHFAGGRGDDGNWNWWAPTPAAVVFALFSASSPWLWGLHTRRAQHVQLLREGRVDTPGAVFSAERWRAFPIRTMAARRWSIDHGVTDPQQAWDGYNAERAARHAHAVAKSRAGAGPLTRRARHATGSGVPARPSGWVSVPVGATVLPIVRAAEPARPAEPGNGRATARPPALLGVPPARVRKTLSDAALREAAQNTYRVSRDHGQRVTGAALGAAYGRGERWGRAQIEAVDNGRTAQSADQTDQAAR